MTLPSPTLYADYNRIAHQMQLHDDYDITPTPDIVFTPLDIPKKPQDDLLDLIRRISSEELQRIIRVEIESLVAGYDARINTLEQKSNTLEQEFETLQLTKERYEKAVREMQFFKKKYEDEVKLNKRYIGGNGSSSRTRSSSMDSMNVPSIFAKQQSSCNGAVSHMSPLVASTSEFSDEESYSDYTADTGTPTADRNRLSRSSSYSTISKIRPSSNASSIYSTSTIVNDSNLKKDSWQCLQNYFSPNTVEQQQHGSSPKTNTTTTSDSSVSSNNRANKMSPLEFGGQEAFWDTITQEKTTDSSIQVMIGNFLRRGGSPNIAKQFSSHNKVNYGYGLIHALVSIKALGSLKLLLKSGANPNAMTLSHIEEDKMTPGYLASMIGWLDGLKALVESGAGAELTIAIGGGLNNKTALHVAAENGHMHIVEYIVLFTPPKYHSQVDKTGASALHYASASGCKDLVYYFIQNCQLSVDAEDIRGETPLHWASRKGHLEVASLLIKDCGSDFNSYLPGRVKTPYDLAVENKHKRLIEYYKKLGAMTSKMMDKKR